MRIFILLFCILIANQNLVSQINDEAALFHRVPVSNNNNHFNTETTGFSLTGSNIDVVYQNLNFTANPDDDTKTLIGSVTTLFKTIEPNVAVISFDLNKTSFNNAFLVVTYHGIVCSKSFPSVGNENVLQISLPSSISLVGTIDSITISYQGIPPAEIGAATGYQREVDNAGNNYIYTLSESYEDRDWWPCKADMQDKIDSLDITVTVPSTFWVASNGVMIDSSIVGVNRIFKFKHRYPIASYLVSLGIAKYKKLYLGFLTSGTKQVPYVVNYFPDKSLAVESNILNFLNNHKLAFNALNSLFGEYPFSNEKHGFYEFGFSGGMEHQTFSGLSNSAFQANSIMAHELGHQWWGDKVTFSTWNHLWLAEGFATYSEALVFEFVPSLGISEVSKMNSIKTSARNNTNTPIYINNITSSNTIWTSNNTTAVYNRGCMLVSMLRALLGDNKFFAACKNFLSNSQMQYKSATTSNLQTFMETGFGDTLTSFFNEWINKKGTPNYNVQWGNNNKRINIQLNQTVNSSGASFTASTFFPMPVILKIADTINGFDTTVIIYHQSPNKLQYGGNGVGTLVSNNIISYNLSFIPNKIFFDAGNKTMATATIAYNTLLPLQKIELQFASNKSIEAKVFSSSIINKLELQQLQSNNEFKKIGLMQKIDENKYSYWFIQTPFNKSVFRVVATTNNGSIYSQSIVYSSVENEPQIKVNPNPANNYLFITTKEKYNRITIKNLLGSTVIVRNNFNGTSINIENLAKGQYILELRDNNILLKRITFLKY